MNVLTEAVYAIALTLWIGGLWAIGYIVAPTLFYTLADRTLLVAAEKDDITPIAAEYRLQTLFPQAELVVIPDVGHLIHYDAPVQLAIALHRWLTNVS